MLKCGSSALVILAACGSSRPGAALATSQSAVGPATHEVVERVGASALAAGFGTSAVTVADVEAKFYNLHAELPSEWRVLVDSALDALAAARQGDINILSLELESRTQAIQNLVSQPVDLIDVESEVARLEAALLDARTWEARAFDPRRPDPRWDGRELPRFPKDVTAVAPRLATQDLHVLGVAIVTSTLLPEASGSAQRLATFAQPEEQG